MYDARSITGDAPCAWKKIAVVTGAGSGIGLAVARLFVRQGAKVVAVDWHADAIASAVNDIGGTIIGMTGNVAEEADSVAMVDLAVAEFGRIDILVNNAGVMDLFQSVADVNNETWHRCMSVNVDGPMFAMRRAVPLMLAKDAGPSSTSPRWPQRAVGRRAQPIPHPSMPLSA